MPELRVALPVAPKLWDMCPSEEEGTGCRWVVPQRARGRVPAMQVGEETLALKNKELVH